MRGRLAFPALHLGVCVCVCMCVCVCACVHVCVCACACACVCVLALAVPTNIRSRGERQVGIPASLHLGAPVPKEGSCCQARNLGALGTSFLTCPVLPSVSILTPKQHLNRPPLFTSRLLPCEGHHHSGQDSAPASSPPLQLILHALAGKIDR